MKMSNKTYDILKDIALYVMPALATLILTLGGIWGIPYAEAIAATITALDTFLGAVLKINSKVYEAEKKQAALDFGINLGNALQKAAKEQKDEGE
jgi:hypothetical protein